MGQSHTCAHAVTFQSACDCLLRAGCGSLSPEAAGQEERGKGLWPAHLSDRRPSSQKGPSIPETASPPLISGTRASVVRTGGATFSGPSKRVRLCPKEENKERAHGQAGSRSRRLVVLGSLARPCCAGTPGAATLPTGS